MQLRESPLPFREALIVKVFDPFGVFLGRKMEFPAKEFAYDFFGRRATNVD
jgi:hypothetical protein